jgi:hypothetical protein
LQDPPNFWFENMPSGNPAAALKCALKISVLHQMFVGVCCQRKQHEIGQEFCLEFEGKHPSENLYHM